jgi:Mg2+ and Co2+ transporter CorA
VAEEEEEHEEAAKNCKLVAQSSVKLTDTLDKFSNAFAVSHSNSNGGINDKLNEHF